VENKKSEERDKGGDAELAGTSLDWMLSLLQKMRNIF
jgi:hypothetical protein